MRIPGAEVVQNVARAANGVRLPMTHHLGIVDLLKLTFQRAGEDHVRTFAAGLTYRALFATFAFLVFLLSLVGAFQPGVALVTRMLDRMAPFMPAPVVAFVRDEVFEIIFSRAGPIYTYAGIISAAAALWAGSNAFRDVTDAMNLMYRVKEGRKAWKVQLISAGLSVAVFALTLSAVALLVFGRPIGRGIAETIGLGSIFRWIWDIVQWPLLICCVLLAFALVYYFAPDVEQDFKFITPGSAIGACLWLCFTFAFLIFVNSVGLYSRVYGALAGLVIHMLYTYYSAYILLLGGQMNQVIEEHAPEGKDPGEKELPPDPEGVPLQT